MTASSDPRISNAPSSSDQKEVGTPPSKTWRANGHALIASQDQDSQDTEARMAALQASCLRGADRPPLAREPGFVL